MATELTAALDVKAAPSVEVDEETYGSQGGSNTTLAAMIEASLSSVVQRLLSPQLETILNKLDTLDGRLGAVEARVFSHATSQVQPPPTTNYQSGMQQAAAQMMQEQLLGLSASVETLVAVGRKCENVLADAVDNMTWALDSFQQQQEHFAQQQQQQQQPSAAPVSPTPSTTDDASIDRISEAIRAMNQRMESVERISSTLIPDIVSKGLEQIALKQAELDKELRASLAHVSASTQDADLLSKLSDLESKFETLPQMYIDTVTVSLQNQTKSLMTVIDDIKEQQTEAIQSVAANNNNRKSGSTVSSAVASIPVIPDMGIKSRLNKLATIAKNRLSSSEIEPIKVASPSASTLASNEQPSYQ
ncbi:hypothetical protein HDU99_002685 [Rhizoclosmatium hyalinum]|nr:hypothetical protein HDU99_002685 [Rhizoclosmatium hyalinum]